jgi:hypothetical protein
MPAVVMYVYFLYFVVLAFLAAFNITTSKNSMETMPIIHGFTSVGFMFSRSLFYVLLFTL